MLTQKPQVNMAEILPGDLLRPMYTTGQNQLAIWKQTHRKPKKMPCYFMFKKLPYW